VKPHGALYNVAADDPALAEAIARAVRAYDPALVLVARAGSAQAVAGRAAGLRVAEEAFADRGYDESGRLVPRGVAGALITSPEQASQRAVTLVRDGSVQAVDGTWLQLDATTLCVHSDTPGASAIAAAVRAGLLVAGVQLRPLGELATSLGK
jgi:5-oxoprolinase (ATP-hydrolysing) subunit A